MIALWEARADKDPAVEPVLNVIDRDALPTHEPEQRQIHPLSQSVTLSGGSQVIRSGALRSERGPALPAPINGHHRPKIAVCSQVPLDSKIVLVRLGQDRRL